MKNNFALITTACLCLAVTTVVSAADYIIIGEPSAHSLLNRYEQPLSKEEYRILGKNVPFRITDPDGTLGDQITPAVKAEVSGIVYFMQPAENKLSGKSSGYYRRFSGCTPIGDTVEILPGNSVSVDDRYPSGGKSAALKAGARLERVFSVQNLFYVRISDSPETYGWCAGSSNVWRRVKSGTQAKMVRSETADTLSSEIASRAEALIDSANAGYIVFFEHFNKLTGQDKAIPHWAKDLSGSGIKWILNEPYRSNAQLDASSAELEQQLHQMLAARMFKASYSRGTMLIEKNQSGR
jgi:hypothetical protein